MILPIYTYGNPVLRKEAHDIDASYPELQTLIANMYETLKESDGIGLAAPQIGLDIRLVIIDLDVLSEDLPEYKDYRHAFINPYIIEYDEDSKKETMEEGEWVEGYLARVRQHQFDHLGGQMFIDRIPPMRRQLIRGKLKNLLLGKFRCAYRTRLPRK